MSDFQTPQRLVRARKDHYDTRHSSACVVCAKPILKGQVHYFWTGVFQGDIYSAREHVECAIWPKGMFALGVQGDDFPEPGKYKEEFIALCGQEMLQAHAAVMAKRKKACGPFPATWNMIDDETPPTWKFALKILRDCRAKVRKDLAEYHTKHTEKS